MKRGRANEAVSDLFDGGERARTVGKLARDLHRGMALWLGNLGEFRFPFEA